VTSLNICEKNNVTTTHPNQTAIHFWVVNKRLRTVELGGVGTGGESAPLLILICQKFGKI